MAITVTTNGSTSVTVTAPASSSVVVTEKGVKGDKGNDGVAGADGPAGAQGPAGADSTVVGPAGPAGQDGASPTASNVAATGAVMKTATSTADFDFVIDEDNFSSNSATKVPTQQSVKALFDAEASQRASGDAQNQNAITNLSNQNTALNTSVSNLQSRLGSGTTGDALSDIGAPASDDKVLIQDKSDSNNLKYVDFGDFGSGVGDITGVTITTDSGGASKAEETSGSADFSILGSNGVGVTNSGTTITATAVPGEIDHDSLNNFVAAEHVDWAGSSAGTIHSSNIPTLNQNTTGSAATLTTPRAINGVNFDGSEPITVTAAGSTLSDTVPVSKGGTGATSLADGHILLGSGSGAVTSLDLTSKGSILVGDGTTDPIALAVGTNGYVLSADSNEASGLKWIVAGSGTGDITSVVAGAGLTDGGTSGDVTLNVVGGTGITASADDIAITAGGVGTTQLADDSVTEDKLDNTLLAEIDANTAKVTNVTTNLAITGTTGARTITSSDGTDAIIPVATTSVSGVMSTAIFDEHTANNAKNTNVSTNLTATTHASQITINSSDGEDVVIAEASASIAGVMTVAHHDKLDGIEASATADQTKSDIDGLAITTVGALSSGSISSGFGNIDNGSSTLDTGAATVASLVLGGHSVDDVDLASEFVDSDNHLMSSAAINDRFAQINASTTGNAATATALATARNIAGVSFNGTQNISLNNNAITNGAGYTTNTGTVDTSGSPVDNDFAKFTDANTVEGRSIAEVKSDLSLNNVENTAISTFAGTSSITTVGTIGTGTWQGTAIASAYLDADTAHLSGTQTFSGAKTFSDSVQVDNINLNANTVSTTNTNGNLLLAANGTGFVELRGNQESSADNPGAIRFNCAANTHGITIKSPPHSAEATYTLTLPTDNGTDGQILKTDGNGVLDWVNNSGSYTHPNHTGEVTSTGDGAQVIADNVVDEANLKVSNSPTDGYVLTAQSGNTGGLTWASGGSGGGVGTSDQTLDADRTIDTNGYNLDIELDPSGTADTFTIHDGTHDLFQVDTTTTGTLFSVNDVSGLPMFKSGSDGTMALPQILTAAPSGTATEGTMQLAIVSGTSYLYVYINGGWKKTTLS